MLGYSNSGEDGHKGHRGTELIVTQGTKRERDEKDLEKTLYTHRLSAFPDDSAGSGSSYLDVRLQLHFLLWPKEVFLLQFTINPALSLRWQQREFDIKK